MQLEADAREALPYVSLVHHLCFLRPPRWLLIFPQSIETCTKDLGPLRQSIFSCLTCSPPPSNPTDPYNAAGICYSCSVQCHGEHQLVEIFSKRNFTCDCGTTRLPATSPCSLRLNPQTGTRGDVHSEEPATTNKYNQNFRNRFCSCECDYDPFQQKGTMFQCLGLGTTETGGCGEDWYHPGCVVGLGPNWFEKLEGKKPEKGAATEIGTLPVISESGDIPAPTRTDAPAASNEDGGEDDDDVPNPPGFPKDDDFETFICFKCVDIHPWIKRYAGTPGFLLPVLHKEGDQNKVTTDESNSKKRKAEDEQAEESQGPKRPKNAGETDEDAILPAAHADAKTTDVASNMEDDVASGETNSNACKYNLLPPTPEGTFSLFCSEAFRDRFCRCVKCFPHLSTHVQLLEEEEIYEPPISEAGSDEIDGSTHGSGSLYERGESALRNVDRVRAIEGVMAYNQLKDKLKPFFQQFAESGQAISAEDIKEYFAKLRGDEQAIKEAGENAKTDHRHEQSGY